MFPVFHTSPYRLSTEALSRTSLPVASSTAASLCPLILPCLIAVASCDGLGPPGKPEIDDAEHPDSGHFPDSEFPSEFPEPFPKDACRQGPCLRVSKSASLCQMYMFAQPAFGNGFEMKGILNLKSGEYPIDNLRLAGSLHLEGETYELRGLKSRAELHDHGSIKELEGVVIMSTDNGQELSVEFSLTTDETNPYPVFDLDSFQDFDHENHLKKIHIRSKSSQSMLGNSKFTQYGACLLPGQKDERFEFDLGKAGQVRLTARSRLVLPGITSQFGLLTNAMGEVNGRSFDVQDWVDLYYSADEWTDTLFAPGLAVRLPEHAGICGFGFVPHGRGKRFYRAYKLNCDFSLGDEIEVRSETLPEKYSKPPYR